MKWRFHRAVANNNITTVNRYKYLLDHHHHRKIQTDSIEPIVQIHDFEMTLRIANVYPFHFKFLPNLELRNRLIFAVTSGYEDWIEWRLNYFCSCITESPYERVLSLFCSAKFRPLHFLRYSQHLDKYRLISGKSFSVICLITTET